MSTHKLRNLIVASAALAGVAAVTLTHTSVPAEARINLSACQIRHSYCTERCIIKNKTDSQIGACIKRTCDKQSPGCGPGSIHSKASSPFGGGKSAPSGGPIVKPSKGGVITSGGAPKGGVYSPNSGPKGPAGGSSVPILLRSGR